MSKQFLRDLPELVSHNLISAETAERIRAFYVERQESAPNRMLVVFGILGALLTGMGIILIIAHNWDELSKATKIIFALLPLFVGQLACGYTLFKRNVNKIWKESSATFLFFAIGAAISIVSQVYNIDGRIGDFLFLWMILALPVIYAMASSMASLLYLIGITVYVCDVGYFEYSGGNGIAYWPLMLASVPHYFRLSKTQGNFFHFHSWSISISLIIALGTLTDRQGELMTLAYVGMLSGMLLLGQMKPFSDQRLITNAFLVTGSIGIIFIMLTLSFRDYWYGLNYDDIPAYPGTKEFIGALITNALAAFLLYLKLRSVTWHDINLKSYAFIIVVVLFIVGFSMPAFSVVAVNMLLFVFAVSTIMSGSRKTSFTLLNYGLLILTALITCRFFDTDLSFVVRGTLFVVVGAGFFLLNYYVVKRKKQPL